MIKNLNKKNKKKGFTLIELIIVIAIIAILAAVALPKFGEVRKNSSKSADIANAKTIQGAVTTLIAEGTIPLDTSFNLDNVSPATYETATINYLQGSVPKAKLGDNKGKYYFVEISNTGNVVVKIESASGDVVYPQPTAATADYAE